MHPLHWTANLKRDQHSERNTCIDTADWRCFGREHYRLKQSTVEFHHRYQSYQSA